MKAIPVILLFVLGLFSISLGSWLWTITEDRYVKPYTITIRPYGDQAGLLILLGIGVLPVSFYLSEKVGSRTA